MEQLGEKQDFECELSRRGLQHEVFTLGVRRRPDSRNGAAWSRDYSVMVTNIVTARTHVYAGGPRHEWVRRFAADLSRGTFEAPAAGSSAPGWRNCRPLAVRAPGMGHSSGERVSQ